MGEIPIGFCQYGCGNTTLVAQETSTKKGWVKGQPLKFLFGHGGTRLRGEENPAWKGGRYMNKNGYVQVRVDHEHPRSVAGGYVPEHILVAEKALGKPLPARAVVHHFNENPGDNSNTNLIICEDECYHRTLHRRQRAQAACGNPQYLKCGYCGTYDDPLKLSIYQYHQGRITRGVHAACRKAYMQSFREKRNSASL